ncbi:MAG TPA: O-antigen ligase family protein [Bacteroidia bacterium]|nr:O-antigen ligase family protein [Bacteroidia bacterium]
MFKLQEIFPATNKALQKAMVTLLVLVAFFLPFKFLVNVFIALVLVAWLLGNPFKKLFTKTHNLKIFLAIVVFYLLHVLALLYTTNIGEGFFSLEIKISMLIFPLVFYTEQFTEKQITFFIKSFIAGTFFCCALCLLHAVWLYITKNENNFYYESLAWFQHPSYLAMYITFCCVVLLLKPFFGKLLSYTGIAFFTVFVLLLSSKTGIILHFGLLVFCIASLFLKQKNYLKVIAIAFIGLFAFCTCLYFIPEIKLRFKNIVMVLQANKIDKTATGSTEVRQLIWTEALQISKEHLLLGVSPGDANDALYASYKEHGITGAYTKKLNAHSQYFQTTVGLGLVGLCSLLVLFITPLLENRKKLVLFFVLITALNFLTESMLQTMAGCIFLGYFYAVICFKHDSVFAAQD